MPRVEAALDVKASDSDVENMTDAEGKITRESVDQWLTMHSGDFSEVIDFAASIEHGDKTIDIPWANAENEMHYGDLMFPEEV
jgi:hypothetical protein